MECLNMMCIYQKDGQCLLDEITIDETGACSSVIYPDIPAEIIENEKTKLREKFDFYK